MIEESELAGNSRRIDQIVELAAQGFTDKEISARLGISRYTVQTHWDRLRERLGVANRTAAVIACLREKIERQNQELREANEALELVHKTRREGMGVMLADVQKRLAEYQRGGTQLEFLERASHIAHMVAYELESVDPVLHRYLSSSATTLGIDSASLQRTDITFYDLVYEEDLPIMYEKSLESAYAPNERYIYVYRLKTPEPRWVIDTHKAIYKEDGSFSGVVGVALDVHDLVLAGAIRPEVQRIIVIEEE